MSQGTAHASLAGEEPLEALRGPLTDLGTRGLLPEDCPDAAAALDRATAFLRAVGDDHAGGAALVAFAPVEALALAVRGDLDRLVIVDDEPTLGFVTRAIDNLGLAACMVSASRLDALAPGLPRFDLVVRAGDGSALQRSELVVSPAPRGSLRPWRLTPRDLADLLADPAPGPWEPLGGGGDFLVYRRGGELLRVARHPALGRAMMREQALLQWLAPRLPQAVPALTLYIDETALFFRGPLLLGRAPAPEEFDDVLTAELAEVIAALHRAPVASAPPAATLAHRLDTAPRRCWRRLLAKIDYDALARGRELGRDRLAALRWLLPGMPAAVIAAMGSLLVDEPPAPPAAQCVIHGDLGNNLLVDDAGRLAALLDWTDAGLGDPARDLGYLATLGGGRHLAALLRRYPRSQSLDDHRRLTFYRRHEALVGALDLVADGVDPGPWLPRICEAFIDV